MHRPTILIVALCALVGGCQKAPTTTDTSAGKAIYDEFCAACHGPDGNVRLAQDYDAATPDLRKIAERSGGRLPRVMLAKIIDGRRIVQAHGSRTMPEWGDRLGSDDAVVEEKVAALVNYIDSIQAK